MQRSFIFTAERRVHPSRRPHHGNATSGVDGNLTYGENRKCFGNFCFKICHSRQLLQGKLTGIQGEERKRTRYKDCQREMKQKGWIN